MVLGPPKMPLGPPDRDVGCGGVVRCQDEVGGALIQKRLRTTGLVFNPVVPNHVPWRAESMQVFIPTTPADFTN